MSLPKIRKQIESRIQDVGDTMAGFLTLSGNPTSNLHAATKQYVDNKVPSLAETANKLTSAKTISLTGDVSGSGNFDGSNNLSITATVADNSHNHSNYLLTSGGVMTGVINMNVGTGLSMTYEAGKDTPWIYPKGATGYGIRYLEGTPDKMMISASGNNITAGGSDLCINGNGDGTVTIRGNTILHAGNYTGYAAKASHSHSISNITNLQSSLDSKINDSTLFKYMHSDFTVEGNANTYYPVFFPCYGSDSHFTGYTLKIGRMYNEAAPDTWNTSTHRGGLTLNIRWSGDYGWGGNGHNFIVEYFEESYCNLVAGIEMCTISFNEGICVWLRGGGALYHAACEYGIPIPKIYYSSFTANNGAVWSPKTSVTSYWWAPYTATTRYPHNVISTGPNGSFYENYTKGNLSCIQSSTPGNTKMLWAW